MNVTAPPENALARDSQNDPDLARLIDAWPRLPEAIRAGILAMIEAALTSAKLDHTHIAV